MPRGGKRRNAGRNPSVDPLTQLAIGAHCEKLLREETEAVLKQKIRDATKTVAIEWEKVNTIPVAERKAWLASNAVEDHRDNVTWALQTDQHIEDDDDEPNRVLHFTAAPPKGAVKAIQERMAVEYSASLGKPLSTDMVKRWWRKYRDFERSSTSDV